MQETYRYSDPLYISKIPAESICVLPFIYIINFLIQNPESHTSTKKVLQSTETYKGEKMFHYNSSKAETSRQGSTSYPNGYDKIVQPT